MVLGLCGRHIVVNSLDHGGRELFGAQAIPAAQNFEHAALLEQRCDDILIQRLAQGARLFGSVENGNGFDAGRDRVHECLCAEGAIEVNLHHADLLAACVHVVDSLFRSLCARAHQHDDSLGIRCADVVEQVISAAEFLGELIHRVLDDLGRRQVVFIRSFAVLEVDIRILRRALLMRMLGVERPGAEFLDGIPVDHGSEIVIIQHLDLGNLVGGSEAVEEVDERNFRLERGKVRNRSHIHYFLHGVAADHGKAGLARSHNVCMIAENAQRVSSQRSCGNMEHAGQKLAGDFVHVGDHEQQALRSRESGSECAGSQRTVHSARSARLALQLRHLHSLAEDVFSSLSGPFIACLRHRRRRRDGVDGADIGKRISNMRGRCVTINR